MKQIKGYSMQNTIFKYQNMNSLQNMIIKNNLEDVLELKEIETNTSYSKVKYSLFHNGKLVTSFEDDNNDYFAIVEAYQYFLGYIDAVYKMSKKF